MSDLIIATQEFETTQTNQTKIQQLGKIIKIRTKINEVETGKVIEEPTSLSVSPQETQISFTDDQPD